MGHFCQEEYHHIWAMCTKMQNCLTEGVDLTDCSENLRIVYRFKLRGTDFEHCG